MAMYAFEISSGLESSANWILHFKILHFKMDTKLCSTTRMISSAGLQKSLKYGELGSSFIKMFLELSRVQAMEFQFLYT